MTPQTFIFIGRSGCGKGTQAALLQDYILKNDTEKRRLYYLESGAKFREFITRDGYSSRLSYEIYEKSERQPDFLAIWNWAHLLIENIDDKKHLIIDGTPRSLAEAEVLDTAIDFYKRNNPVVIHIDVSRKWSEDRLMSRKRADDIGEDKINKRLNWFEKDVQPAIGYFEKNSKYKYIKINGEQTVENVNKDINLAVFK